MEQHYIDLCSESGLRGTASDIQLEGVRVVRQTPKIVDAETLAKFAKMPEIGA